MTMAALSLRELSRRVLDTRHGLFRGLGETPRSRQGGDIFIMGGEIVDPKYFLRLDRRRQTAGSQVAGAGLTREEALWSTLGEGIERYSAQILGKKRIGTYTQFGKRAIDPRDFLFYADRQYDYPNFLYKRFDPDAVYTWADAKNLLTGEYRLAPMQMAALGAELCEGEAPLCQSISTGIASHTHVDSALLSGLLEVIERDAFMATWQLRRPPPHIDIEPNLLKALDPRVAALLCRTDLQIKLFLITTNNTAPAVLCTIHRRDPPATAVGASARLRLTDAITKATIEAYHTWAWALTLERKAPVALEDIVEFEHHVRHYFEPASQKALSFLDDGEGVLFHDVADSGPASREELAQALHASGHDVFSVDLTSPDVAELGFVVFRTMVSGMQPLACGVRNYPLDDRRLRRVASDWGFPFPRALNSDPHPFP